MSGAETIDSINKLLEHPRVRESRVIELCICDAVHFRLISPRPVFDLIEMRLCQRNPELYTGFADLREVVEKTNRGASIQEKIDYCCVKRSDWVSDRQILYSAELEVWMDISYPNPWALELYHATLKNGKWIHIPKQGPFTEIFHKLLLQKNGFERLAQSSDESERVQVFIGSQVSLPSGSLQLLPAASKAKPHAIGDGQSLAEKAVAGVILRDSELQAYRNRDAGERLVHDTAFQLIGPTLLLLLQSLREYSFPVAFSGMGSGFLTTLCESLRHYWPWVPAMANVESAEICLSLFPGKGSSKALLPDPAGETPSILELDVFDPVHLLLPPVESFLKAFLRGSDAAQMQASAAAFLIQYAQITRGLHLQIPPEPVFREWWKALLSPEKAFLRKFTKRGCVPDFNRSLFPWKNLHAVKQGAWPTASFLISARLSRLCMRMCAPKRVASIRKANKRIHG